MLLAPFGSEAWWMCIVSFFCGMFLEFCLVGSSGQHVLNSRPYSLSQPSPTTPHTHTTSYNLEPQPADATQSTHSPHNPHRPCSPHKSLTPYRPCNPHAPHTLSHLHPDTTWTGSWLLPCSHRAASLLSSPTCEQSLLQGGRESKAGVRRGSRVTGYMSQ